MAKIYAHFVNGMNGNSGGYKMGPLRLVSLTSNSPAPERKAEYALRGN